MKPKTSVGLCLLSFVECIVLARGALGLEWINDAKYTNADEQFADAYKLRSGVDPGTQEAFFGIELLDGEIVSSGNTWVGIGVSDPDVGSMLGADVMTAEISGSDDRDGLQCQIYDRYVPWTAYPLTEDPGPFPVEDDCNVSDWKLLSCQRDSGAGIVRIEVSRPLSARDDQDRPITEEGSRLIWAYGSTFQYHRQKRGAVKVQLFPETKSLAFPPSDTEKNIELIVDSYKVPVESTTYACQSFEVPVDEPMHIIGIEPIIPETTKKYIHHYILSQCIKNSSLIEEYKTPTVCGTNGAFEDTVACASVIYGWAKGAEPYATPLEAGFRLDGSNNKFILQVHYDNSDLDKDIIDASGVRFYTTSKLRTHDAGVLNVGDVLVLEKNPIEDGRRYQFSCPSQCTEKIDHEITIFRSGLHMHNLGKTCWTNHYDKDQKLKSTLAKRNFWDGGFQASSVVDNVIFEPGDSLQVSCIYDLSKVESANFGLATTDEMCMDFLSYYPLAKLPDGTIFSHCGLYRTDQIRTSVCGLGPEFVDNPTFADDNIPPNNFGNGTVCPTGANDDPQPSNNAGTPTPAEESPSATETDSAQSSSTDASACFAGAATVELADGSHRTMADLQVGDRVRTGATTFSDVFTFSHAREGQFKFRNITTVSGKSLLVSSGHLILVGGQTKTAGDIALGDVLSGGEVKSIEDVVESGLYNPHTLDGFIVVNGLRVTVFTTAVPPKLAKLLLSPVAMIYRMCKVNVLGTYLHNDRFPLIRPLVTIWNSIAVS
eukprot:Plantae.Rhodophyta-Purpureofilum_apyrenoidigerum.ctg8425.p1 GENE.Plantae.Rhodophyta-Purpureofilum_apyrenoidigerum.ctg8425~~Plantae.Rhodophyta-Purpureofilum_apyrenoidigerum.ctg8425.p1  ORF type:complete len:770 (+),score=115.96 Plantae.Rhodophyta-Purpureofilum_apyrenoidigerum.ctg8425:74-2383(+)